MNKCLFSDKECNHLTDRSTKECQLSAWSSNLCETIAGFDYEKELEILRAIAHLRSHKEIHNIVPTWSKNSKIIRKNIPKGMHSVAKTGYIDIPCGDHYKQCLKTKNDSASYITESYDVSLKDIKELINFCEKRDLDFHINGNSVYFPGMCIRIEIKDKED